MPRRSYSIGVDLGGTNIKIVVISNDGNVLDYLTCDTADAEGSWATRSKTNSTLSRNSAATHLATSASQRPDSRHEMVAPTHTCRDGSWVVEKSVELR